MAVSTAGERPFDFDAGIWLVYEGLLPAERLALPPTLLLTATSVIGCFVHGSFIFLGEFLQLLETVTVENQSEVIERITRQMRVMKLTYAAVFLCGVSASIVYTNAVALGRTSFPHWMALVNPVFLTIGWLLLKKVLPLAIARYAHGAGFNIA